MSLYKDLVDFLNELDDFYIEVEGQESKLRNFIVIYNSKMSSKITMETEGIRVLGDDVNKWGLEFRLYTNERPRPLLGNEFHINRTYRSEYKYRCSKNELIEPLLYDGFYFGHN